MYRVSSNKHRGFGGLNGNKLQPAFDESKELVWRTTAKQIALGSLECVQDADWASLIATGEDRRRSLIICSTEDLCQQRGHPSPTVSLSIGTLYPAGRLRLVSPCFGRETVNLRRYRSMKSLLNAVRWQLVPRTITSDRTVYTNSSLSFPFELVGTI